jgi:outer membrane protein assembly factor BamA
VQAPRIRTIRFVGNSLFATDSIKTLMGLKEGGRLTDAALDRDMALLARYFERARVTRTDAPGGMVDLTFDVEENPLVVDVRVYGAAEVSDTDILARLSTKIGQPLFEHNLMADAQAIVAEYRRKGYYFVHVPEPVIRTPPGGGRRVDFTIVEGPLVSADRIVFRGNQSIRRGELLELMETKQRGFWDFLAAPPFREDTLREDLVAIADLYRDEGFLDVEVALEDLRFSDDKERVQVSIAIQEHQAYTLGDIKIEIERPPDGHEGSMTPEDKAALTEEAMRGWLRVKSGERWSGKLADWGRDRILEQLYRRSYLDANVGEARLRGRESEAVADLVLPVKLGWKYRLRRLDFVGNEFTRDSYLRREVRLRPGGYADRNELERGEARLKRTRYFDRSSLEIVDVPPEEMGDTVGEEGDGASAWKGARYEIVEAKTGRLGFSVGLSTSGGLFGTVSFQKRNFDIARWPRSWDDLWSGRAFTGNGQTFDIALAPGTETTTFGAGFTEPNLFGSDWQLTLRGYRRLEYRDDHEVDRLGYQLGLARPVYRRRDDTLLVTAGLRWRQEQVEVNDLEFDATPGAQLFRGYNQVNALRAYLTVRANDDVRRNKTSFEGAIGLELLGTALGGDIHALKLDLAATQSWVLAVDDEGRRRRLSLRGVMGWAEALEDTPEVPGFERFYLGGNDFRGFANRGVGPHINGYPTGGEWLLAGSIEYTHPLFGDTVAGVVFLDVGTLGTALGEDDAWKPRLTVGPGIRLKIPMLGDAPLALDFGFVLMDEPEDERQLFTFSLSRDF